MINLLPTQLAVDASNNTPVGVIIAAPPHVIQPFMVLSPGNASGASEQVALSPLASQLSDIAASLASSPAVDRARVDDIKSAISEGRLQVNPSVVADKLIETVRQLLSPRNP